MPDYSNSCVYKLSCKDENVKEVYIGSSTNLYMRKSLHKSRCNNEKDKSYDFKLYKFIRENGGYDNWQFDVLEEVKCNSKLELHTKERYHIELHDNNLNRVIPTRSDKEYREDNKTKIKKYREDNKEKIKKYREDNKEKIKKYHEDNKTKILESKKKYREDNKEKIKQYYQDNKDKIKQYYQDNKDKIKQYYEDNKQEILEKYKEYSKQLKHCNVCNCDVKIRGFLNHTRTEKHIKNLKLHNDNMVCEKIEKI